MIHITTTIKGWKWTPSYILTCAGIWFACSRDIENDDWSYWSTSLLPS